MGQLQFLAALLTVFPQIGYSKPVESHYPPLTKPIQTRQFSNNLGAVACESEICSTIGVNILREGGNAADAMVATVLCVGTVGKRMMPVETAKTNFRRHVSFWYWRRRLYAYP